MSITWQTKNQEMTFVNHNSGVVQGAWNLAPNTDYDVYVTLANSGATLQHNVKVNVVHSAFGIGLPGGTSFLTEPAAVDVAPTANPSTPGLATLSFGYHTPQGGHSCLTASIESINGVPQAGLPVLSQNTTISSAPTGVPTTFSFNVFGNEHNPEIMHLVLAEKIPPGTLGSSAQSWNPQWDVPPQLGGWSGPATTPLDLSLPANAFFAIGLKVKANGTVPHTFRVEGFVNGASVGLVELQIQPVKAPQYVAPAPYVHGGYQSADIVLTDQSTGMDVPIGGMPGSAAWDTLLEPDSDFGFSAIVHNSGGTAANTVVRFWSFPGGMGTNGTLLDIQSVTVPAAVQTPIGTIPGSVRVRSAVPFHSAPPGQHACAAISIYNAQAGTCPDAWDALRVPDPTANVGHSCSAWRNTDSLTVLPGVHWKQRLDVEWPRIPIPDPGPLRIEIVAQHVPAAWKRGREVQQFEARLLEAGGELAKPAFLLQEFQGKFEKVDLHVQLTPKDESLQVLREGPVFVLHAPTEKATGLVLTGEIPKNAKPGDSYLVQVTARYESKAFKRSVQFLTVLHVTAR